MPVEADIVEYLDSQLTETAGVDLFAGPMPEQPENCLSVVHYGSQESDDFAMGPSLTAPGSEVEDVQVMARNTSRAAAVARANAAHAALDNLQGHTPSSGKVIFHVTSDGPPFFIGLDKNGRHRFVGNYHVRKQRG